MVLLCEMDPIYNIIPGKRKNYNKEGAHPGKMADGERKNL